MPPKRTAITTTTTPMTDAAIKALIAQGVADALAGYKATRNSGNGDENHESRSGLEYGRYGVSKVLDMAYQGFLGLETTHRYAVSSLMDTAYWLSDRAYEQTPGGINAKKSRDGRMGKDSPVECRD
ncbi:hypothetical protein Tco_0798551 [Tanacetum coccineum]